MKNGCVYRVVNPVPVFHTGYRSDEIASKKFGSPITYLRKKKDKKSEVTTLVDIREYGLHQNN